MRTGFRTGGLTARIRRGAWALGWAVFTACFLFAGQALAKEKMSSDRSRDARTPDVTLDPVWVRANAFQESGKLVESAALYESLLKRYPESHELHRALAGNLIDLNQVERALLHANTAKSLDPSDPGTGLVRAEVFERMGRMEEAEREYAAQAAARPHDPRIQILYASVLRKQGRHVEARRVLDPLTPAPEDRAEWFYESALCAADAEDWSRAGRDLSQAERLGYRLVDPLFRLRIKIKDPDNR